MSGTEPGAAGRPRTLRTRIGHLEERVPGLSMIAPRLVLADLPTPVVPMPDLARRLGLADLLIKRDDASSQLFGGTKVRGLEYFLGLALASGRTAVATLGSAGSNHVVATATFAREVGMASCAVLFPHPDPEHARRNVARLVAAGGVPRSSGWIGLLPAVLAARLCRTGGRRPLWIPPGGSSAIGVLGAAEGALEVVEAARAGLIRLPEDVVVAAGSCGTAAGLALGFALGRAPVRIVAVRVVPRLVSSRRKIARLVSAAGEVLQRAGLPDLPPIGRVAFVHGQAGAGYARTTEGAEAAVTLVREAGLPAETTYTGKAWAHVLSGALRGRRVLFWNTFGG